jgi:branched-chain amino acid transport system permease protein
MYYNIGQWWMGYQAGLRAFTAAVLGGIGSMRGAALGASSSGFSPRGAISTSPRAGPTRSCSRSSSWCSCSVPSGLLGERSADKV